MYVRRNLSIYGFYCGCYLFFVLIFVYVAFLVLLVIRVLTYYVCMLGFYSDSDYEHHSYYILSQFTVPILILIAQCS